MKKIILIVGGVLIVVIVLVLVMSQNKSQVSTTTPVGTAPTTTTTVPNSIVIKNFSFNPSTLTVKVGTVVTWTNEDSVTHTVESNTFNSGNLKKGDTFQFTFNTVGTFNYNCGPHPAMIGTIVVQ